MYVISPRPKLSSFLFLMLSTSRSMATWSKDFLLVFIELFRQEEWLWKVKSKDYYNRSKKDASYETLIGKVQEVEPDDTRHTVFKKVNNLRSAFRKEHKKFQNHKCPVPVQKRCTHQDYDITIDFFFCVTKKHHTVQRQVCKKRKKTVR